MQFVCLRGVLLKFIIIATLMIVYNYFVEYRFNEIFSERGSI